MPSIQKSKQWKIINTTRQTILCERAVKADTFISRLCGLIPRKNLALTEGLIITRCKSIHMIFMRFAIDAVFVNKKNIVVGVAVNIKPYQFSRTFWKSSFVVEMTVGAVESSRTQIGDQLTLT